MTFRNCLSFEHELADTNKSAIMWRVSVYALFASVCVCVRARGRSRVLCSCGHVFAKCLRARIGIWERVCASGVF